MFTQKRTYKGFSIFIALGITTILLIVVTGLAMVYMRELKLSNLSYDDVLAGANAEGAFEYGMLKIRNHRDGFADALTHEDIDGRLLALSSPRSQNLESGYTIESQSTGTTFDVPPGEHLIIPLFVGSGEILSHASQDPRYTTGITITQDISVNFGMLDTSWTLIALSGSENVGLMGSGNIVGTTAGIIRTKASKCYTEEGKEVLCENTNGNIKEELVYFYDTSESVEQFLTSKQETYFMVQNLGSETQKIEVHSKTPFALPQTTIEAYAQKKDALQVFRFSEDTSRYYDALKYGTYNTDS